MSQSLPHLDQRFWKEAALVAKGTDMGLTAPTSSRVGTPTWWKSPRDLGGAQNHQQKEPDFQ